MNYISWALELASMSGEGGIARAHLSVPNSARWHAVTPLAATVACPYAYLLP